MFKFDSNSNRRFRGTVTVRVGTRELAIDASDFSLEEAGTRGLGDGDQQYEELWIGHPDRDSEANRIDTASNNELPFEAIHVHVVRFNDGFYQFQGDPKVISPEQHVVRVEDDFEFIDTDDQGPQAEE